MALIDWILSRAGSTVRLIGSVPRLSTGMTIRAASIPNEILDGLSRSSLKVFATAPLIGSRSDVTVVLLRAEDRQSACPRAVLKFATTKRGKESLQRSSRVLKALAADERLEHFAETFPRLILEETWGDAFCTVETAVPGTEGRSLIDARGLMPEVFAEVSGVMADMHHRTSSLRVIDDAWAHDWIDRPIEMIARVLDSGTRKKDIGAALLSLRRELREVFIGREERLGLGHGDLWLGNMFFSTDGDERGRTRLTGLIDWDASRADAPAAIDACHLGLTFRMERSEEELGPVVRDLLLAGKWSPEEAGILRAAGLQTGFSSEREASFTRAIILLTWLNHVATVFAKSERASLNAFWLFVNVTRVLAVAVRTPVRTHH